MARGPSSWTPGSSWSYTALSRARDPVAIFVVDEPTRVEQEREEIALPEKQTPQGPLDRMARRIRERDDEDLALEQLEHAGESWNESAEPGIDRRGAAAGRTAQSARPTACASRASPQFERWCTSYERCVLVSGGRRAHTIRHQLVGLVGVAAQATQVDRRDLLRRDARRRIGRHRGHQPVGLVLAAVAA